MMLPLSRNVAARAAVAKTSDSVLFPYGLRRSICTLVSATSRENLHHHLHLRSLLLHVEACFENRVAGGRYPALLLKIAWRELKELAC